MHFLFCFCILSQLFVHMKCIYMSNALHAAICMGYGICHITFGVGTTLRK